VGAALAAGEISREQADIAVRAMGNVPQHLLAIEALPDDRSDRGGACGGDLLDAHLADVARRHDTAALRKLAVHLLEVVDPDGRHPFDPQAADRRFVTPTRDRTGMLALKGQLDQPGAAARRHLAGSTVETPPCPDRNGRGWQPCRRQG
jgi:hypothetical protein